MNVFEDTLHRVLARANGRAILTRGSSSLSDDPDVTIGIATIKIVTEEQIQAVAFGFFDREPEVIVRLDPIGRDVSDLLPFAQFLIDAAERALRAGGTLRVWIPHSVTLEAIDVLGHRYWRNQKAPEEIRRMGEICRIIAHEATFPGQQVVADATSLLKAHVVTGLSPVEEGHLGAVLAWVNPSTVDPVSEARERIRLPASGVLPNTPDCPIDDLVDKLRKQAKKAHGARQLTLQRQIADNLRKWVVREWRLLVEAREAFHGFGLPTTGLGELLAESTRRLSYALTKGHYPDRQPHKLAIRLAQMSSGLEKADLIALENDPAMRAQAQRAGAVVVGVISNVAQPRRGYKPCAIEVDSTQGVIRLRVDDKVQVPGTSITGVVRTLAATPGGTRVTIEVTKGVRERAFLQVGVPLELLRQGYGFVNYAAMDFVARRQPWLFYGTAAPALPSSGSVAKSPLEVAAEVRRT